MAMKKRNINNANWIERFLCNRATKKHYKLGIDFKSDKRRGMSYEERRDLFLDNKEKKIRYLKREMRIFSVLARLWFLDYCWSVVEDDDISLTFLLNDCYSFAELNERNESGGNKDEED